MPTVDVRLWKALPNAARGEGVQTEEVGGRKELNGMPVHSSI